MTLFEVHLNNHGTHTGLSSYSRHISVISYAWTCYICSCARVFSCGFLIAVFLSQLHFYTFFTLSIPDSPICNPLCIIWMWIMDEWTPPLTDTWSCTGPNCKKHKSTCVYKINSVKPTRCSWCYAYRRTFSSTIKRKLTATKQDEQPPTQITNTTTKATGHKCRNDAQVT
jgi:hypothetical protein